MRPRSRWVRESNCMERSLFDLRAASLRITDGDVAFRCNVDRPRLLYRQTNCLDLELFVALIIHCDLLHWALADLHTRECTYRAKRLFTGGGHFKDPFERTCRLGRRLQRRNIASQATIRSRAEVPAGGTRRAARVRL